MSRIDELRERLKSEGQQTLEKIQDSALYAKVKDRYDNLSPMMQKLSVAAITLIALLILISSPMSSFSTASENEQVFLERRQLIRDFLRADRASGDLPDIEVPPPVEQVKSQVQNQAQVARLIPEQIGPVQSTNSTSKLISADLLEGEFLVNYTKLNLKQIVDLGAQIQGISPSVKLREIDIKASPEDPRYLNVVFSVAVLKVPQNSGSK